MYVPASAAVEDVIVNDVVVAPEIVPPSTTSTPPFFHLYEILDPVTDAVNVIVAPAQSVWPDGCVTITGVELHS